MKYRTDMQVDFVQRMGSDEMIARAARVSTNRDTIDQGSITGLVGYLARERHTSPFEHCVLTVRAEVPIFVAREWERHRTQSYSEFSMRFSEAEPAFYLPPSHRPLVNEGSGAHPRLVAGTAEQESKVLAGLTSAYETAWTEYTLMLEAGVANEVARSVLPVGVYTKLYATANLNNWFKFLTLRDGREGAPQWEIVQAAKRVAEIVEDHFPVAYAAFEEGRSNDG